MYTCIHTHIYTYIHTYPYFVCIMSVHAFHPLTHVHTPISTSDKYVHKHLFMHANVSVLCSSIHPTLLHTYTRTSILIRPTHLSKCRFKYVYTYVYVLSWCMYSSLSRTYTQIHPYQTYIYTNNHQASVHINNQYARGFPCQGFCEKST